MQPVFRCGTPLTRPQWKSGSMISVKLKAGRVPVEPGKSSSLQKRSSGSQRLNRSLKRQREKVTGLRWPVVLFIASIFVPWLFEIGSFALSPYRLVLIILIIPVIVMWISGKAERVRVADIALLLFWMWCFLSLLYLHGLALAVQPAGILLIETLGPYLLARCYIRNADDFYKLVKLMYWLIVLLLPFSIVEAFTGTNLLSNIFGLVMRTHGDSGTEPRWGLTRVQSVFEHPILYGVSTGSAFALVQLVLGYRKPKLQTMTKTALIGLTSLLSLSAGPVSAIFVQWILVTWNGLLSGVVARWKFMWALIAAMYLLISIVSNQTVPEFYLTHFSFDQASAYYRVLIWTFGLESSFNHPLFGVGLGEWDRPDWMPPSIDMFWLIHAVKHGFPAGFLMLLAFFSAYLPVSFKSELDGKHLQYRTAYVIVMTGFFLVGWTVHFWNATYVLFMFLLGSGMWLLDVKLPPPAPDFGAVK